MIYTERTKRAMKICLEAHAGQVDKGGYPYCMHPIHLAEQMDNESACIVALLHDVLEDCEGYTLQNLVEAIPLTEEEKNALFLITHIKTEPYPVYCKRLSSSPLARQVKIADLRHNLDLTRLGNEPHPKYEVMKECLEELLCRKKNETCQQKSFVYAKSQKRQVSGSYGARRRQDSDPR